MTTRVVLPFPAPRSPRAPEAITPRTIPDEATEGPGAASA